MLREIIGFLRSTGCIVAVTASTGIASVNIGGTTLHSWAGIGLGGRTANRLSRKILGTKSLRERWLGVDSLIIDESEISSLRVDLMLNKGLVSMVGGILFDKLVGLYTRPFCMTTLMPSRKRSHERLEIMKSRLGAFRSTSNRLFLVAFLTISSACSHWRFLPIATSTRSL